MGRVGILYYIDETFQIAVRNTPVCAMANSKAVAAHDALSPRFHDCANVDYRGERPALQIGSGLRGRDKSAGLVAQDPAALFQFDDFSSHGLAWDARVIRNREDFCVLLPGLVCLGVPKRLQTVIKMQFYKFKEFLFRMVLFIILIKNSFV